MSVDTVGHKVVTLRHNGSASVVVVGRLDEPVAREAADELAVLCVSGAQELHLDLGNVAAVERSALRALRKTVARVRQAGCTVAFVSVSETVMDMDPQLHGSAAGRVPTERRGRGEASVVSGLIAVLLLLALVFGGVGLFAKGLTWLLIIAVVLFLASGFTGWYHRGHRQF